MADTISYGDFIAKVRFSDEDDAFIGEVVNISDSIAFHAETVSDLRDAFQSAVDDYIEACASAGQEPARAFSGNFRLRLDPSIHREATVAAQLRGVSLNQLVSQAIINEIDRPTNIEEPTPSRRAG